VSAGVTREPIFVLAGRTGVVVADGVHTAFPGSPTHVPRSHRTAHQSFWAPCL
jgi:hypothetical protein